MLFNLKKHEIRGIYHMFIESYLSYSYRNADINKIKLTCQSSVVFPTVPLCATAIYYVKDVLNYVSFADDTDAFLFSPDSAL